MGANTAPGKLCLKRSGWLPLGDILGEGLALGKSPTRWRTVSSVASRSAMPRYASVIGAASCSSFRALNPSILPPSVIRVTLNTKKLARQATAAIKNGR